MIHRSKNRIICVGDADIYKPTERIKRGWFSPDGEPYRPLGDVQNHVPVIEELKIQLENTTEIGAVAQKYINNIKRDPLSVYKNAGDPERVWKIIQKGMVDLKGRSFMENMEKDKINKPSKFGQAGKKQQGYQIDP